MLNVEISDDKKEKYQSFTASAEAHTGGGMGERQFSLTGWGKNESEARLNLIEQAKAARDELNLAIEQMIAEAIS